MAIETRGFNFSPGESRLTQIAPPPQFQLVSGQSLVGDSGISEWAAGMSSASRMMRENMSSLLAGVTVGVGGITDAFNTLSDRKFQEEQADKKYERDLEVARIRAAADQEMSPKESLEYQLKQLDLREKQRQGSWAEWPEGATPPPLSEIYYDGQAGGAFPDPNLNISPEDVPLEPLPEGGFYPDERSDILAQPESGDEPALPGINEPTAADVKTSGGQYQWVIFPDGSKQLKDQSRPVGNQLIGRVIPPESKAQVPEGYEPDTITVTQDGKRVTYKKPEEPKDPAVAPEVPEGMRLKGVKSSDGKMSYDFEVDTSDEDIQREITAAQANILQANRVIEDIDLAVKLAKESNLPAAGKFSEWVNKLPVTTGASDLRRIVNNISADVAFERLARMRRESKTGGALGAVSERELALLQAAEGSIDPSLSPKFFISNMLRIKDARQELIKMWSGKLEKLSSNSDTEGSSEVKSQDNSKELESQIKALRASISQYPQGSQERQEVLNQIQAKTTEFINLTGKTPEYR
jgi:phosphoribosylformylglycinamidine (FGAM) synthase PurS component